MLAHDIRDDYEVIEGVKFMAPVANLDHSDIIGRLHFCFVKYFLEHKNGYAYTDDVDVHFSDGTLFKPDLIVVLEKNADIIDWYKGIYGAPDMVVEVLSKSTRKNDLTIKKDAYEANGIREYWIIDPWIKSVTVYLLRDGKYQLDDEYILFNEEDAKEVEWLTGKGETVDVKHEIPVKILEGLTIPIEFVFSWGY